MKFKVIACKSMSRELSYLAATSPNIIDFTWIRQGYHDTPEILQKNLQAEIDLVESRKDSHTNAVFGTEENPRAGALGDFDAILIGYGLCSNGVVGIHAKEHTLVIPRGHDCITMFLGSKERYQKYFNEMSGCFWYTASWIESCGMPCEETHTKELEYYKGLGYTGADLDFFKETLQGWTKHYKYAGYIEMPFYDNPENQKFTKDAAKFLNWEFKKVKGSMRLFEDFISGNWSPDDFLIVPPGYTVYATNDENIIDCKKMD